MVLIDKGGAPNSEGGGFDPVTEADKGAERAIRALITERYPHHGVIGEEYGEDRPDSEWVWVLDPVDGTRAFIAGLPVWTTLIGLRHHGRPFVLGSIRASRSSTKLYIGHAGGSRLMTAGPQPAAEGPACLPNSGPARSSPPQTRPSASRAPRREAWRAVRAAARLARLGCDAYGATPMVAAGTIDLVVETGPQGMGHRRRRSL